MNTPLSQAAMAYVQGGFSRFHMPGHKGQALPLLGEAARYDLTEVTGLDSLYHAEGTIARLEAAYAQLYGTRASLLSAGGSTLCIQAMLALACRPGDRILAARGLHTAAIGAMALLDLHPAWLYPRLEAETGLAAGVEPEAVEAALAADAGLRAVYLTSPSYYGVISEVGKIAAVCRRFGVPLLVDNAHGAHLRFLSPSLHPIGLGADICCDSLHKTLPVLTGGALLQIGNGAYLPQAKERMALFGSTSPSYLIMLSADGALPYLRETLRDDLRRVSSLLRELGELARERGFRLPGGVGDPLRLTLDFGAAGYTKKAFTALLRQHSIEPELLAERHCVLMASGFNTEEDFGRLRQMLLASQRGDPLPLCPATPVPEQACPPREAAFAQAETVPVEAAAGRIAAGMVAPCPPGIPLVVGGERIDEALALSLKNVGIFSVNVLK